MLSWELKPTDENIKNTLLNNTVGRNEGIAHFLQFLDATEGNTVIALDDSWGNGKTFFVKQLQLVLKNCYSSTDEASTIMKCIKPYLKGHEIHHYIPIYYDAWSNDSDDDPALSIIYSMLQEIDDLQSYEVTDNDWSKTVITALELITTAFSGLRIKDFLESIKGINPLSSIKSQKKSDKLLNNFFDILLEKQDTATRILFFIDELDRCRPDFAVKILERIKHYFLHDKVIFVFSVNTIELQHTIKQYYGIEFDSVKYLTRFFDFMVSLPFPNMDEYYRMLNFLGHSRTRDYIAKDIIKVFHFSLRDITRYLQLLRMADPIDYDEYRREFGFYMEILIPFLFGLKIHDLKQYEKFIQGIDYRPFLEFVQQGDVDWYCHILLADNETFKSDVPDKKTVSIEGKFSLLYRCLFGFKSRNNGLSDEITIGGTTFSSSSKNIIMSIMSFVAAKQNLPK